jgi:flagellar biosynthetic protein FliS
MSAQANAYRETQIQQADPVRLVGMLYDGALKHTRAAAAMLQTAGRSERQALHPAAVSSVDEPELCSELLQLRAAQLEQAHLSILRAFAIVSELTATLDFEAGGAVAGQLERLYDYALHLLREADMHKDAAPLAEAERLLAGLRESWQEAFPQGLASLPAELRDEVGPQRQRRRPEQPPAALAAPLDAPHDSAQGTTAPAPESGSSNTAPSGLNLVG